jgi:hypothetical protein
MLGSGGMLGGLMGGLGVQGRQQQAPTPMPAYGYPQPAYGYGAPMMYGMPMYGR